MPRIIDIYCDESCHLENDRIATMVIGAIWCPDEQLNDVKARIRDIKRANNYPDKFEIKWGKISPANEAFYLDLVNYFFDESDLHLRACVVTDKAVFKMDGDNHPHDDWYYGLYFSMLSEILRPDAEHRIYIDIKDTNSESRRKHLQGVLTNSVYDYSDNIITRLQAVESRHVSTIQLADVLIGAISAANRGDSVSAAKLSIIEQIRKRSKYTLTKSTLPRDEKVQITVYTPESWREE